MVRKSRKKPQAISLDQQMENFAFVQSEIIGFFMACKKTKSVPLIAVKELQGILARLSAVAVYAILQLQQYERGK